MGRQIGKQWEVGNKKQFKTFEKSNEISIQIRWEVDCHTEVIETDQAMKLAKQYFKWEEVSKSIKPQIEAKE